MVAALHGRSRNAGYSLIVHRVKCAGAAVCAKSLLAASIVAQTQISALVYVCHLLVSDALWDSLHRCWGFSAQSTLQGHTCHYLASH